MLCIHPYNNKYFPPVFCIFVMIKSALSFVFYADYAINWNQRPLNVDVFLSLRVFKKFRWFNTNENKLILERQELLLPTRKGTTVYSTFPHATGKKSYSLGWNLEVYHAACYCKAIDKTCEIRKWQNMCLSSRSLVVISKGSKLTILRGNTYAVHWPERKCNWENLWMGIAIY